MFEDSTFESAGRIHTRSRGWMIAAFTFNASILVALVLIPLICPEALPRQVMAFLMEAPTVPPAPQTQPKPIVQAERGVSEFQNGHIFAPSIIPKSITTPARPEQAPGGDFAYMDPGTLGGMGVSLPGQPTPRVVRPNVTTRLRVSTAVEDGLLIERKIPVYPPIGLAAHVEGTVTLAATISKTGSIENLRVTGGPPMLRQAALDAVATWRYRPYLLDGEPVEVETTVNVIFSLGR